MDRSICRYRKSQGVTGCTMQEIRQPELKGKPLGVQQKMLAGLAAGFWTNHRLGRIGIWAPEPSPPVGGKATGGCPHSETKNRNGSDRGCLIFSGNPKGEIKKQKTTDRLSFLGPEGTTECSKKSRSKLAWRGRPNPAGAPGKTVNGSLPVLPSVWSGGSPGPLLFTLRFSVFLAGCSSQK